MNMTSWGLAENHCILAFCRIYKINNPAFRNTNNSGKTLDTRQEILHAALGIGLSLHPLGWANSLRGSWDPNWASFFKFELKPTERDSADLNQHEF